MMLVSLLSAFSACEGVELEDPFPDTGTTDTGPDTTDTDDSDTTDTGTDTDPHTGETVSTIEWDDDLAPGPVTWDTLTGFTQAEDFTFDDAGYFWSVEWNGTLVKQTIDGAQQVIANQIQGAAGTSILGNGDIAIAETGRGQVIRVTQAGGKEVMVTGFSYPNGITVSQDGFLYISEHSRGVVLEVDPDTYDVNPVGRDMLYPNGIALSPDGQRIYTCSFGDGSIYAIDRGDDGEWGDPYVWARVTGGGGWGGALDGLNVDACGNVYVTEYIAGKVWRFREQGGDGEMMAKLNSSWIPNLHWGKGVGGFEEDVLYVSDRDQGRLFALKVGVGSTPQVPQVR